MSPKTPPRNETAQFILYSKRLSVPFCIMDQGSNPNLPNNLINSMLPKAPVSVFPVKPKEYFFLKNPVRLAAKIPMKILVKEIKAPVKIYQFYY